MNIRANRGEAGVYQMGCVQAVRSGSRGRGQGGEGWEWWGGLARWVGTKRGQVMVKGLRQLWQNPQEGRRAGTAAPCCCCRLAQIDWHLSCVCQAAGGQAQPRTFLGWPPGPHPRGTCCPCPTFQAPPEGVQAHTFDVLNPQRGGLMTWQATLRGCPPVSRPSYLCQAAGGQAHTLTCSISRRGRAQAADVASHAAWLSHAPNRLCGKKPPPTATLRMRWKRWSHGWPTCV